MGVPMLSRLSGVSDRPSDGGAAIALLFRPLRYFAWISRPLFIARPLSLQCPPSSPGNFKVRLSK